MPLYWWVEISVLRACGFIACLTGHAWALWLLVLACDAYIHRGSMTKGLCARALCTEGRVSGGWLVWARWIPARAATTSHACHFNCWFGFTFGLADAGFLCCVPISKAVN